MNNIREQLLALPRSTWHNDNRSAFGGQLAPKSAGIASRPSQNRETIAAMQRCTSPTQLSCPLPGQRSLPLPLVNGPTGMGPCSLGLPLSDLVAESEPGSSERTACRPIARRTLRAAMCGICGDDSAQSPTPHGCRQPQGRHRRGAHQKPLDTHQRLPLYVEAPGAHPLHQRQLAALLVSPAATVGPREAFDVSTAGRSG